MRYYVYVEQLVVLGVQVWAQDPFYIQTSRRALAYPIRSPAGRLLQDRISHVCGFSF